MARNDRCGEASGGARTWWIFLVRSVAEDGFVNVGRQPQGSRATERTGLQPSNTRVLCLSASWRDSNYRQSRSQRNGCPQAVSQIRRIFHLNPRASRLMRVDWAWWKSPGVGLRHGHAERRDAPRRYLLRTGSGVVTVALKEFCFPGGERPRTAGGLKCQLVRRLPIPLLTGRSVAPPGNCRSACSALRCMERGYRLSPRAGDFDLAEARRSIR